MHTRHRRPIGPHDLFEEISGDGITVTETAQTLLRQVLARTLQHDVAVPIFQYHPLGFFCIRWNFEGLRSVRIHIWSREFNWTQAPNWPIHDHIFDFKSSVLHGLIQNKTYAVDANKGGHRKWNIYEVSYSDQQSTMTPIPEPIELRLSTLNCQPAGSMYELPAGIFHRSTLRSQQAVTVLATTSGKNPNTTPRVVGTRGGIPLTFNRQPNDNETTEKIVDKAIAWLER